MQNKKFKTGKDYKRNYESHSMLPSPISHLPSEIFHLKSEIENLKFLSLPLTPPPIPFPP